MLMLLERFTSISCTSFFSSRGLSLCHTNDQPIHSQYTTPDYSQSHVYAKRELCGPTAVGVLSEGLTAKRLSSSFMSSWSSLSAPAPRGVELHTDLSDTYCHVIDTCFSDPSEP
jgi:hypothetical protein